MTFDFFNELRRITDAYLAQTQVGIPESIKKTAPQEPSHYYDMSAISEDGSRNRAEPEGAAPEHDDLDDYEPDWYGDGMEEIDRYADDPRHDQCRGGKFKERP